MNRHKAENEHLTYLNVKVAFQISGSAFIQHGSLIVIVALYLTCPTQSFDKSCPFIIPCCQTISDSCSSHITESARDKLQIYIASRGAVEQIYFPISGKIGGVFSHVPHAFVSLKSVPLILCIK
jgi:hypothetical protein